MKNQYKIDTNLRTLAVCVLSAILVIFVVSFSLVNMLTGRDGSPPATGGQVVLTDTAVNGKPIHLYGDWELFAGTVCRSPQEVQALGQAGQVMSIPIGSIVDAQQDATYRLRFLLPSDLQDKLLLYIPNFYKSADIYLNGVHQPYLQDGTTWVEYSPSESMVPLTSLLPNSEWQELVISAPFAGQDTTLYKRPIMLGTMKNLVATASTSMASEMFIFGLLLLILLNGYVFMLFRPGHMIISMMTLFDTLILLRTSLAMGYVVSFFKGLFPWLPAFDYISSSVTLSFLLLAGIVGCKLSTAIYDPESKAPKWLIKPVPWLYGLFAVVFPLTPAFFEQYGKYVLFVTYGITFVGVFWQYIISWEIKERRVFNLMQFIKTIYLGVLVLYDILTWDTNSNYLILFCLYSIFFALHVVVRLYDNNESYRAVESLNAGLEDTVRQRTQELSAANQILSELSIRDPLTQIYNRLHFEQAIEKATAEFTPEIPVHLCIFDLDLFKNINDTYGHGVGDEQLRSMVKLVNQIVGQRAVFARVGGEEFVLLFCGHSQADVMSCIEQVHQAIAADAAADERHTTASFGVSSYYQGDTAKQLMIRADMALYEAKRTGRNRIVSNLATATSN